MLNMEIVWYVSLISALTTGKPADVFHPNHQRTHDKVLDMPFLV